LAALRSVHTVHTVDGVREAVRGWRGARETVAFVPTMGNLHAGHIGLTELARRKADRVVLSIFVNPTQFGAGEDFGAYPRTLDEDAARVTEAGTVDLVFVPNEREIYPFGAEQAVRLTLPPLSRELCGASRPGHFEGVASVVCRLLNIVTPDVLLLGQKDYQQWVLVGRMIADLRMPVTLEVAPTRREPDGLAMSSRNRYLDAEERRRAPALHAALEEMRAALRGGAQDYAALEARARERLAASGFRPDYVEVRRAADLAKPAAGDRPESLAVVAAAWLGRARLIDNVRV
jgi:pantoate--beta-alanine ligase